MSEEKKDEGLENEDVENEDVENQDNKDESGKSGSDNKSGNNKETKSNSGKSFTQEQVNKMMTREKNQGRNAAYKELGIDPKDSKTIAMFKAFVESQKTEEQKAAEKESENQTKINEAERRMQIAEAKAEAMMLGVKTQHVEDVVTLALAKMTEDADLKTIIGEFKTKYPIWFGESDNDDKDSKNNKTGQKGTGSSVKNSGKEDNNKENKGLGARLAAQRKSGNKKSSYWGK